MRPRHASRPARRSARRLPTLKATTLPRCSRQRLRPRLTVYHDCRRPPLRRANRACSWRQLVALQFLHAGGIQERERIVAAGQEGDIDIAPALSTEFSPLSAPQKHDSGGRIRTCDLRVMRLIRWIGWTCGARFQADFARSNYAEIGWNLWVMLPHLLPQIAAS
jgi:hypothetical protein